MSHGFSQRRKVDYRDVSPQTGNEDSFPQRAFREQLATSESFGLGSMGGGEILTFKVLGPAGVGRWRVESPRDSTKEVTLPSAPGVEGFVPGQEVLAAQHRYGPAIIAHPPGGQTGNSRHQTQARSATIDVVEITSADPGTVGAGETVAVTLTGIGFLASPLDTFTAVKFDETDPSSPWVADTLITLGTPTWVSSTEVTISVTAASGTPAGHVINIRVQRT